MQQLPVYAATDHNGNALWDGDLLGRGPDAENLLEILKGTSEPIVILLEGPWGSGKTQFVEHLPPYLEQRGFAVKSINAWEEMRFSNPLITIMYAIAGYSPDASESNEWDTVVSMFKKWAIPAGVGLGATTAPGAIPLVQLVLDSLWTPR